MKDMVAKLLLECHYAPTSIPGVVFGHSSIRQHILDTLNERRRVHQGYYFEQRQSTKTKEEKDSAANDNTDGLYSAANDNTDELYSAANDNTEGLDPANDNTKELAVPQMLSMTILRDWMITFSLTMKQVRIFASSASTSSSSSKAASFVSPSSAPGTASSSFIEERKSNLTQKSAEVITMKVFGALKLCDITRQQLALAAKKLGQHSHT